MTRYYKEKSNNSETIYYAINMQTNSYLTVCTIEKDFFINSRQKGADIRFTSNVLESFDIIEYNDFRLAYNYAISKLNKINEHINKF